MVAFRVAACRRRGHLRSAPVACVRQHIGSALPRARPFTVMSVAFQVPHAADPSIPSVHATLAFAVTVVLGTLGRTVGVVRDTFNPHVVSRIYLEAPYPSDVLGGAAMGAVGAWVTPPLTRA